jgi:hypothetical protein
MTHLVTCARKSIEEQSPICFWPNTYLGWGKPVMVRPATALVDEAPYNTVHLFMGGMEVTIFRSAGGSKGG